MLDINKKLYNDIKLYCDANNIDDINKFCNNLLQKAFTSEVYGSKPEILKNVDKKVENKVYNPENEIILPTEKPKEENKVILKKANLKDDYTVYDDI